MNTTLSRSEHEYRIEARDRWKNDLIRPLTAAGIFLGSVRYSTGSFKNWQCDFSITNRSVGQEEIKIAIETFIQGMFSGYNFQFYRRKDGTFYVIFDIRRT